MHTFILVHTSHCGSRFRATYLHETLSSTCHLMSERLLFLSLAPLLSLHYLPLLCSELQLHNVEEAEQWTQKRTRKMIQPSHRIWAQPARQLRLLRGFCSDLPGLIRRHRQCDAELDDELVGKALSSPLFIQEREKPANLRQTYHSHEECSLPAQSFCTRTSTGRPVYEPSSDLSQKRKSSRDSENERIRILFERQTEQNIAEVRSKIQKHELHAESDKRSILELNGGIIYWFSAKGNWSYYCKRWTSPSGSSWNLYQKCSWDGRNEESQRITNRWILEKKIDRKSRHY